MTITITEMRSKYSLEELLVVAGIPRSTYYYRVKKYSQPDKRAAIILLIKEIFEESEKMYGHRLITGELERRGIHLNRKTVYKIMRENGMECLWRKKKYHHYGGKEHTEAPNLLDRDFTAGAPMQKLVTDVTEFSLPFGKMYFSPVMDLYGRHLLSWDLSASNDQRMIGRMLARLKENNPNLSGVMLHSDQGMLYRSHNYLRFVEDNGVVRSMSRRGDCYDNSVIEHFFGHMKSRLGSLKKYNSPAVFAEAVDEWCEMYNNKWIQLGLGFKTPAEYVTEYKLNH